MEAKLSKNQRRRRRKKEIIRAAKAAGLTVEEYKKTLNNGHSTPPDDIDALIEQRAREMVAERGDTPKTAVTSSGEPIPWEETEEGKNYEANLKIKNAERAKVLDEAAKIIFDHALQPRHREVVGWLCEVLGDRRRGIPKPMGDLISEFVRAKVIQEYPAYREAGGHLAMSFKGSDLEKRHPDERLPNDD